MTIKSDQSGPRSDARQTSQTSTEARREFEAYQLPPIRDGNRTLFFSSEQANERLLQNMSADGDALTEPRNIEFEFVFPNRRRAKNFARTLKGKNKKVEIFRRVDTVWQAIVSYNMVPSLRAVTDLESALTKSAELVGGAGDGLRVMLIREGNE